MRQITYKPGFVLTCKVLPEHKALIIYLAVQLLTRSSGFYSMLAAGTYCQLTSLQQTGFTSQLRHRSQLWALTPLVSSLPSRVKQDQ